jgi:DNA-binding CsgD family transcriptional regulator
VDAELVDRIYECAFLPELWPCVLGDIAHLVDGRGGALLTANAVRGIFRWTASDPIRDMVAEFVNGGWLSQSRRRVLVQGVLHAGFFSQAATTPEEFAADTANRDFFLPRGLGWAVGTTIALPTTDRLLFSVERDYARGLVEPETIRLLDTLRPHLARSALLSARLQMERARALGEAMDRIGLPALVLDEASTVLGANALAESLHGHLRWRARDRVSLTDSSANALLIQAMATLDAPGRHARSFPVRGPAAAAALVAHVIPLAGAGRDFVLRCAAILVFTPVALPNAPSVELIQSLFDLTPAEARVARHLATGSTVNEIASADAISRNTVRTQVRSILEKTGCRRQTEIVAILGRIAQPQS